MRSEAMRGTGVILGARAQSVHAFVLAICVAFLGTIGGFDRAAADEAGLTLWYDERVFEHLEVGIFCPYQEADYFEKAPRTTQGKVGRQKGAVPFFGRQTNFPQLAEFSFGVDGMSRLGYAAEIAIKFTHPKTDGYAKSDEWLNGFNASGNPFFAFNSFHNSYPALRGKWTISGRQATGHQKSQVVFLAQFEVVEYDPENPDHRDPCTNLIAS